MLKKPEVKYSRSPSRVLNIRPYIGATNITETVSFDHLFIFSIGYNPRAIEHIDNMNVENGVEFNERIGRKINVKRYIVKGTFTLTNAYRKAGEINTVVPNYYSGFSSDTTGWICRVIMYQVKGGSVSQGNYEGNNYHPFAPSFTSYNSKGIITNEYVKLLLPDWSPGAYSDGNYQDISLYTWTVNQIVNNTRVQTMPLAEGITKCCRILKNKTYYITNTKPIVNFRVSSRKIGVLEFPHQLRSGEDDEIVITQTPTAVYCVFIFTPISYIYQTVPYLTMSATHKLEYTDP